MMEKRLRKLSAASSGDCGLSRILAGVPAGLIKILRASCLENPASWVASSQAAMRSARLIVRFTFSGMMGSFILTFIIIYLFSKNIHPKFSYNLTSEIIIFSIIVSAISQLGDIIISYFKRISKIKDTGKIIPGHGGLLDRIDGMIFAYPFSYIIILSTKIVIIQ